MLEHLNSMHPLQSPQRHLKMSERLSEHTRNLPPLKVGDHVRIQNQTNNYLTKWDRTGRVVKVKQYHQYLIRVDGSGRIKMKNRKFLRKFTPLISDQKPYPTHHPTTPCHRATQPDLPNGVVQHEQSVMPSDHIQSPAPHLQLQPLKFYQHNHH